MLKIKQIVTVILIFFIAGCSSGKLNYKCDFFPEQKMPEWITGESGLVGEHYVGIGFAGRSEGGPAEQMRQAVGQARLNAANSISSSIVSTTERSAVKENINGSENFSDTTGLKSKQTSHIVLKNIQITDKWLNCDSSSCYFWARAVISKSEVQKLMKAKYKALDLFNSFLLEYSKTQDSTMSFEERIQYLSNAKALFYKTDFYTLYDHGIDTKKSADEYWESLLSLSETIMFDRDRKKIIVNLLPAVTHYSNAKAAILNEDYETALDELSEAMKISVNINYSKYRIPAAVYYEKYRQMHDKITYTTEREHNTELLRSAEDLFESTLGEYEFNKTKKHQGAIRRAISILNDIDFSVLDQDKNDVIAKYKKRKKWLSDADFRIGDSLSKVQKIMGKYDDWVSSKKIVKCTDGYKKGLIKDSCTKWEKSPELYSGDVALKYGDLWFQFNNGLLKCVVRQEGFEINKKNSDYSKSGDSWSKCQSCSGRYVLLK